MLDHVGLLSITATIPPTPEQPYRRKSKKEIQEDIDEIGRMLAAGMVDREIQQKLGLKRATYFIYRAKLYQQHGLQFDKTEPSELAYHKDLLQERLTRIFRQLELDLTRTGTSTRDKAMIGLAMQNIAANIFKLNFEGLRVRQNGWLKYGATDGYLQGDSSGERDGNIHVLPSAYAQQQEGARDTTADRGGTLPLSRPPDEEPDESEIY